MIRSTSVELSPYNVLAARVLVETEHVETARLVHRVEGEPPRVTPWRRLRAGVDTLILTGLKPRATCTIEVEAMGAGGGARSAPLTIVAGELPAALAPLRLATVGAPGPGYTLITPVFLGGSTDGYVVAFDSAGEIRWYRHLAGEGWAVEARQQPNGNISAYFGRSYGWHAAAGRYIEFRGDGAPVRSFSAAAPYFTDPHDLLLSFRDTTLEAVHLLAYDIESYPPELTRDGRTSLAVHRIIRQNPDGGMEFEWNAGAHFSPADWPEAGVPSDLVHPSSLDLDGDGNYIVSLQAIAQIVKIDARSGAILWRLSGVPGPGDYIFVQDPLGGFRGQHSVRELPGGNLLLLDNRPGSDPGASRAVEYRLDHAARTATLVWEFRPDPGIASPIMGSVQRLRNGNTLVGFGVPARIFEVGPDGQPRWDAVLISDGSPEPVQFYRAVRIASLDHFEAP